MTADEIIAEARQRSADSVRPYKVADAVYYGWLNEAIAEACERAHLLYDNTAPFLALDFPAGTGEALIDESIRVIQLAWRASDGKALVIETDEVMRGAFGDGWASQRGVPQVLVRDADRVRISPVPEADETIRLAVYRVPTEAEQLSQPQQRPPFPHRWHRPLVHWLLYRAYAKPDPDLMDEAASEKQLTLFEQAFGRRKSARYETVNRAIPIHARAHPVRII